VDIRKSFDTISQKKLYDIVEKDVFQEEEYLILKYCSVIPIGGKAYPRYCKTVCLLGELPQFNDFAARESKKSKNAVIIDQVVYPVEETSMMLKLLRELIFNNLISVSNPYCQHYNIVGRVYILQAAHWNTSRISPISFVVQPFLCRS
jgi:hypothetical protein